MSRSMRLVIFSEFVPLKLLFVVGKWFTSIIVMFKMFKPIKGGFKSMVISNKGY